jgi:CTP synthase
LYSGYGGIRNFEHHRRCYEVYAADQNRFAWRGMRFPGMSFDGILTEIIEYDDSPWFIGAQFHPELKSRPFAPHLRFSPFMGCQRAHNACLQLGAVAPYYVTRNLQ